MDLLLAPTTDLTNQDLGILRNRATVALGKAHENMVRATETAAEGDALGTVEAATEAADHVEKATIALVEFSGEARDEVAERVSVTLGLLMAGRQEPRKVYAQLVPVI